MNRSYSYWFATHTLHWGGSQRACFFGIQAGFALGVPQGALQLEGLRVGLGCPGPLCLPLSPLTSLLHPARPW